MTNPMTKQQQKILNLIAHDMSTKEIASLCNLQEKTVKNHTRFILRHLGTRSRTGAVVFAAQQAWVNIDSIQLKRKASS